MVRMKFGNSKLPHFSKIISQAGGLRRSHFATFGSKSGATAERGRQKVQAGKNFVELCLKFFGRKIITRRSPANAGSLPQTQ